jgi:hypothetical protein
MLLQASMRSKQHHQQQALLAPLLQQKHTMLMALPAYRWSLQEMRWAAVAVSCCRTKHGIVLPRTS